MPKYAYIHACSSTSLLHSGHQLHDRLLQRGYSALQGYCSPFYPGNQNSYAPAYACRAAPRHRRRFIQDSVLHCGHLYPATCSSISDPYPARSRYSEVGAPIADLTSASERATHPLVPALLPTRHRPNSVRVRRPSISPTDTTTTTRPRRRHRHFPGIEPRLRSHATAYYCPQYYQLPRLSLPTS